jgi:hypothetical protein
MTSSKSIGCCAAGGDVDHARGRRGGEVGPQHVHQHPAGEVVHGELQFVAVRAGAARGVGADESDAGVAHQQVELGIVRGDGVGEIAHGLHGREVGGIEARRALAGGGDFVHHGLASFSIAAVHNDVGAVGGERQGQFATEAVGRTGDQGRLAVVGESPGGVLRPGSRRPTSRRGEHKQDHGQAHGSSP